MRKRFAILLGANGRWPDGQTGGINLPFSWVKVDNKGAGSVDVGLNSNPTAGDKIDTLLNVGSGKVRIFNVGPSRNGGQQGDPSDAWPDQLWLTSTAGSTVLLEVADHPIIDLVSPT